MAFKATYVDASTFTVPEDRTGEFVQGRRVLADCGDDGEVTSHVTSSSYDNGANETTVNIYDSVLTSNLSDVWYGAVSPGADGSLPIHDHSSEEQGGTGAVPTTHDNSKHSTAYLADAPDDGNPYLRKSGAWAQPAVQEAPDDGKQYARENKTWAEVQAMQEHDNAWHSKEFVTAAAVRDEAASVHFAFMDPADAFKEGDIVSFTTEPAFKEGSTESFTTTTS